MKLMTVQDYWFNKLRHKTHQLCTTSLGNQIPLEKNKFNIPYYFGLCFHWTF